MNKVAIKKMAQITGLWGLYNVVRKWRDNINCDRFECGIGDILLQRDVPSENQLLLTSRLLDVEAYLSGQDKSFPFQNTISYADYGVNHRENVGNTSFKRLIDSYLKDGYHSDSYIVCDLDMNLMDGNHRMGLNIYEKIERVNVKRVHRRIPFQYGGDWFYDKRLNPAFMERIYERFNELQKWLIESGNTFCIHITGDEKSLNDATIALNRLCKVLNVIKGGGIERFIQFSMPNPSYSFVNGKLCSRRVSTIKQILLKLFPSIEIDISYNCLEGKELIMKSKKNELL